MADLHCTANRTPVTTGGAPTGYNQRFRVRNALRGVQAKLRVSQPGDAAEREADTIANAITATPGAMVQLKCSACEEEEKREIRRKGSSPESAAPAAGEDVVSVLGPGQPLDAVARDFFEPRFGMAFRAVRVHTGAAAAESARALNARAYTLGKDIVFGAGEYQAQTEEGKHLLAHELTHVVQQQGGDAAIMRQASAPPGPEASFPATVFTPGISHDHLPTGKWADVQKDSSAFTPMGFACSFYSPAKVLSLARDHEMSDWPLAQKHLDHFLTGGGVDLPVDIADIVRRDVGVQGAIAGAMTSSPLSGSLKIEQYHYDVEDFQYALGAIDILQYEVDSASGMVHVWFKDRYEFHPSGYGYSALPGDFKRDTNCVHAAAVEMKSSGAADYWMVGDALVPLSLFGGKKTYSFGTSERQESSS
ncbi:MAG: DUF4157 domain-containing protein [Sulfuricella sp.]|jgi:hypothetical protein